MRRLRVLFIHGFESGPKGRRSVALGRHFECYTPWMRDELEPLLRWRRNRVVHACIALLILLLALAFLAAYVTHNMGGSMVSVPALLLCLVCVYLVVQSVVLTFIAHPAVHGCLQKQRAALLSFKPDVVVGSSWGGGIATYLLMEGAWCGPTVLLAPAGGLISRRARFPSATKPHIPPSVSYVHVVHSTLDRIVPVQDTIDLVQRSLQLADKGRDFHDGDVKQGGAADDDDEDDGKEAKERIKLTIVDDDDHPLSRTMREDRLREAILDAYNFAHRSDH
jgi:hypothetical protein